MFRLVSRQSVLGRATKYRWRRNIIRINNGWVQARVSIVSPKCPRRTNIAIVPLSLLLFSLLPFLLSFPVFSFLFYVSEEIKRNWASFYFRNKNAFFTHCFKVLFDCSSFLIQIPKISRLIMQTYMHDSILYRPTGNITRIKNFLHVKQGILLKMNTYNQMWPCMLCFMIYNMYKVNSIYCIITVIVIYTIMCGFCSLISLSPKPTFLEVWDTYLELFFQALNLF